MKIFALPILFYILCFGADSVSSTGRSSGLTDNIFREQTVPNVWRQLVSGKEESLRQSFQASWKDEDSKAEVSQLLEVLLRDDEPDYCVGCTVSMH